MSRIVKNSAFNLGGQVLPLLIALAAVPVSLHGLGIDRYGVLTLAWTMLGYFAFFDLGLGRGTTRFFAEALSNGEREKLGSILRISVLLNLVVGVIGLIALILIAPWLTTSVFRVPAALVHETTYVFIWLAFSIPMITVTAVLRGVLEATQRFDLVNMIKAPSNASIFLIPLVCLPFGAGLVLVVQLMVASRLVTAVAFYLGVARMFPQATHSTGYNRAQAGALLRYGGWVTVTNLLNPLVIYGERFIIGAVLSLAMLSYYSTPYDLISRLAIIPYSLSLTLFPMFSGRTNESSADTLHRLVVRPSKYLMLLTAPLAAIFTALSPEILRLWLGAEFALQGALPMSILAVAFFFNSLAYVPLAAVQGLGRPDLKAKLDIAATALFGVTCWLGIAWFGIAGAAWAKLLITLLDAAGLLWFTLVILRVTPRALFANGFGATMIAGLLMLGAVLAVTVSGGGMIARVAVLAVTLVFFVVMFFKVAVSTEDRVSAVSMVTRMKGA